MMLATPERTSGPQSVAVCHRRRERVDLSRLRKRSNREEGAECEFVRNMNCHSSKAET